MQQVAYSRNSYVSWWQTEAAPSHDPSPFHHCFVVVQRLPHTLHRSNKSTLACNPVLHFRQNILQLSFTCNTNLLAGSVQLNNYLCQSLMLTTKSRTRLMLYHEDNISDWGHLRSMNKLFYNLSRWQIALQSHGASSTKCAAHLTTHLLQQTNRLIVNPTCCI